MKSRWIALATAAALSVTCSAGFAQDKKAAAKKGPIVASADKATFKEVAPGISKAALWGDDKKGAYGSYTKFAPGADAGMHTHSSDVWILVIKGAYLYKDEGGDKRVGPGDFIRIPARHKHWSGADKKDGALFYEESSGKFDLVPAK